MKSTWTEDQQQYLDNMKNEIKQEIDQKIDDVKIEMSLKFNQMSQKIDNNHNEIIELIKTLKQ